MVKGIGALFVSSNPTYNVDILFAGKRCGVQYTTERSTGAGIILIIRGELPLLLKECFGGRLSCGMSSKCSSSYMSVFQGICLCCFFKY